MKENLLLAVACACAASPVFYNASKGNVPADWMPLEYGDDVGAHSCIIHTDNIVSVHPVYDMDTLTSRNPVVNYLDLYLADGRRLTIYEDYEEFVKKITKHSR